MLYLWNGVAFVKGNFKYFNKTIGSDCIGNVNELYIVSPEVRTIYTDELKGKFVVKLKNGKDIYDDKLIRDKYLIRAVQSCKYEYYDLHFTSDDYESYIMGYIDPVSSDDFICDFADHFMNDDGMIILMKKEEE